MKKLLFLLLSLSLSAGHAQEAQKWEYAMYDESQVSSYFYRWQDGDGAVYKSAGTLKELLADLGCPSDKDYAARVMLFNCVGKQGWQLVLTSNATLFSGKAPIEFYFKRPVK